MKLNNKFILTAVGALLAVSPIALRAACGAGLATFANSSACTLTGWNAKSAGVTGNYWALGAGVANNGTACPTAGTNGGTTNWLVDNADGTFPCGGAGQLGIVWDWQNACNVGCVNGAAGSTTVVLLNDRINEGAANHAGRYAIFKLGLTNVNFQGYEVETLAGGGNVTPVVIPTLTVCTQTCAGATYNHATGTGNVVVTFTQPASLTGPVNGTAAAGNVITGYEVYQINATSAPTTSAAASWGAALTQATPITCGAGTCSGVVTVTTIPNVAGTSGYLALRLVMDGGYARTDYVSANSAPIAGPLAVEGVPTSIELYPTKVNNAPGFQVRWTSTNESTIAGYKVMASSNGSNWVVVKDAIATKGPGTYTQSITRRTLQSQAGMALSYQIKVLVVKRDGSTSDAGPAVYTWTQAEPRK